MNLMTDFEHFCADSRKAKKGSLFFALKGEKSDGHEHLQQAKFFGATAAVVHTSYRGPHYDLKLFHTENPLMDLSILAKKKVAKSGSKVVAITGSVGKTTTKEFLAQLLDRDEIVVTKGNQNTKISLPLTILNEKIKPIYVLEMGMSEPNDISNHCQIAPPDIAVLTQVGLSHAQNFSSFEQLVEEKKKILHGAKSAYVHSANRLFVNQEVVFYAQKSDELFRKICLAGSHIATFLLENLHAAVLVAQQLGQQKEEIFRKIPFIKGVENRFSRYKKNGIDYICDAYNASYLSFEKGISQALMYNNMRKIAVVSQMQELGQFSKKEHQKVAQKLAAFDRVFCLGDFCADLKNASCFSDKNCLFDALNCFVDKHDLVYIKGSNSSGLHELIHQVS